MQLDMCQRWNTGRSGWSKRPAIDTRLHSVESIPDDKTASDFVARHHYLGSMPAARFRFGLYREGLGLAGVAVFSVPCRDAVVSSVFPGDPRASLDLGRFVLLDCVEANGETWFLGECFRRLRTTGIEGVVAFSDPMPRKDMNGDTVMPGHVGTIYQAFNACYLGRRRSEYLWMLPNGRTLHRRTMSKIRKRDRGWLRGAASLVEFGADEPCGNTSEWLDHWLPRIATRKKHPGNHKYAWAVDRRIRKHLPRGTSHIYPKKGA